MKVGLFSLQNMMELLLVFCSLFVLSFGQITCPRGAGSKCLDGDYPNPLDCTTYYTCHVCIPLLRDCPDNLHFSAITRNCQWPFDANCVVSTTSTSTQTPITTTQIVNSTANLTTPGSPSTPSERSTISTSTQTPLSTTQIVNSTATLTTPGSPTTPAEPENVAFAVALTYAQRGIIDPVEFDREEVNIKGAYSNGYFTVPEAGVYFFHTSVAAHPDDGVSYALSGTPYRSSILRTSNDHDGPDTLGRDIIVEIPAQERLHIVSEQSGGVYSDGELQTSWSGVSLSGAMNSLIAFCANRISPWSDLGKIALPSVILNRGNGFQAATHIFRAPVDGIYYFTFSVGAVASEPLRVNLISQRLGNIVELWRDHRMYVGDDTLSRSTMVYLIAGDELWIELRGGYVSSSAATRAISFCGFLYDPKSSSVAWSVHKTDSWLSNGDRLDYVNFQDILVNEGNAWNVSSNTVTIPRSGVYFVHANVGALSGRQVNFNMVYNNVRSVGDVFRGSVIHNGVDTLGRGLIGSYDAGDVLHMSASPGTGIHSDPDRQTSFTGFLLIET